MIELQPACVAQSFETSDGAFKTLARHVPKKVSVVCVLRERRNFGNGSFTGSSFNLTALCDIAGAGPAQPQNQPNSGIVSARVLR